MAPDGFPAPDRSPAPDRPPSLDDAGEVVGFGSGRPRRPGPADLLRRHPWVAAPLVVVVVATTVVMVRANRPAPLRAPRLLAAAAVQPTDPSPDVAPWSIGPDGRPAGPVVLTTAVRLRFEPSTGPAATVLGIVGAGLSPAPGAAHPVGPASGRISTDLVTRVDCAAAIDAPATDGYGIRLALADGTRTATRTVDAAGLTPTLSRQVREACGSWLARRDLTVTAATAHVDPVRPWVRLGLTITNSGSRDASVALARDAGAGNASVSASPTGALTVGPGASTKVAVAVGLRACDSVAVQPIGTDAGYHDTQKFLRLFANVGGPVGPDATASWFEGAGPTGIVVAPAAGRRIDAALRAACGDLTGFAALIAPNGVRYDAATRTLTVRLQLDGTPGRIRSLDLVNENEQTVPAMFTALWSSRRDLVPDQTGQVTTTLRYRAPRSDTCANGGVMLPGFGIVATVPTSTGVRTVRFKYFGVPWQESVVVDAVCAAGDAAALR